MGASLTAVVVESSFSSSIEEVIRVFNLLFDSSATVDFGARSTCCFSSLSAETDISLPAQLDFLPKDDIPSTVTSTEIAPVNHNR